MQVLELHSTANPIHMQERRQLVVIIIPVAFHSKKTGREDYRRFFCPLILVNFAVARISAIVHLCLIRDSVSRKNMHLEGESSDRDATMSRKAKRAGRVFVASSINFTPYIPWNDQ